MKKEHKVAIIVLNWNGLEDTLECLDSLRASDHKEYTVVLVDNASDQPEGRIIKDRFPEVHLIRNETNRGFAGGNNDGINWALENGFDHIVNLNNDCIVEPDWLSKLIRGIETSGADFGTSRIMYYPEKELICSDGDALLPDGSGIVMNHLEQAPNTDTVTRIFSACGAGSVYSAECLRHSRLAGGEFFDELYFAYYEDVDLGLRLNMKGYKGVLIPDAVIYHKGTKASGFRSDFHQFQIEKNRLLTEILDFPVYLMITGEIFYIFKSLLRKIRGSFGRARTRTGVPARGGILKTISMNIKARVWIMRNFDLILKKRRERKAAGLLSGRVARFFYFDLTKIINA